MHLMGTRAANLAVKMAAGLSTGNTGRQVDGEASGQSQGVTGTQDQSEAPAPPEEERAGGGAADEPAPAPPKKLKKGTVNAPVRRSTRAALKRPGEQERDDDQRGGEDHKEERGTGLE
ncbi:hypothetical protein PtA15_7A794 [Puccinia triticina]|uniref:Uncharacterized protein n=1 Tax=Puccinia triticina TaxID=208348 RepID=A0ABY7CTH0_9BASI|nr:uncharacterized protein PtA15_7A794 [Puccinia triticina]WAQ87065.1 hypothetical protein PtA15_7A794 [Puccinia triticina]